MFHTQLQFSQLLSSSTQQWHSFPYYKFQLFISHSPTLNNKFLTLLEIYSHSYSHHQLLFSIINTPLVTQFNHNFQLVHNSIGTHSHQSPQLTQTQLQIHKIEISYFTTHRQKQLNFYFHNRKELPAQTRKEKTENTNRHSPIKYPSDTKTTPYSKSLLESKQVQIVKTIGAFTYLHCTIKNQLLKSSIYTEN